jgi:hypothetical protein
MVLVAVLAVAEVASVARVQLQVVGASREGARVAAVTPDTALAIDAARRSLPEQIRGRAIVTVTRPAVVGGAATVEVTLVHRVGSLLVGGVEVKVGATSTMRVER